MSTAELSSHLFAPIEIPSPSRLLHIFTGLDLAMDLGTANTLIYAKNRGIILNEPSVVAVEEGSRRVLAVGQMAKEMFGKTSRRVLCVRPMKDGVIADFEMTTAMIRHMVQQVKPRWAMTKPRMVIGVPSGVTQVEKKAVIDATQSCGVREVLLTEESMAAALGAGLPVDQPVANMIVDIGGGTTEVAIIAMHSTMYSHSIRVAGDEMDEAIQRRIKKDFCLQIGIFEAERIKLIIGSALPYGGEGSAEVFGRDLTTGMPKKIEVSADFVRGTLQEPIQAIVSSVVTALEQTSPEISRDIVSRGIHLAGGGSLLRGLAERLQRETSIRFFQSPDPLSCVARGVGRIVDNLPELRGLCIAN